MKITHYIYTGSLFLLFGAVQAMAQETNPPKKTEEKAVQEEVEIIRPYKPILAEAVKLRRSPDLENTQAYKAKFNYSVTDRKLELNSDIKKLQAQQLADERQAALLNNYVKGGIGNLSTLLLEGYVNTGRDEALQAGAFVKHLSQQGKLEGQDETNQQFTVFGKSILDKATLSGRLNYQRHGVKFYGFDPALNTANPTLAKQNFNFIEGEGEIVNRFTEQEDALSYAAKINIYNFSDKFNAKETMFNLSGSLNKRIRDLNFGLGTSVETGTTKGLSTSVNNSIFRLNPYIRIQTNGINITAGINFVQEFGTQSTSRIFPAATADLTLVPEFLQFFAEVNGDVNRTTIKDLTDVNPFLGMDANIENSVDKLKLAAGIKGNAGPGFGYRIKVYSNKVGNMPLFVNRFADPSRFDVIYDRGNTRITGLEGSIVIQVADQLTWTGKINLEQYKPATESKTWFIPPVRAVSDLVYTYNKQFSFSASLYGQGESVAKVFTAAPAVPYVNDPTKETITSIKGFIDLGLGASYKINSKLGAFAKVNNIFNQNYNRFLYYPSNGFNILGGISYSF